MIKYKIFYYIIFVNFLFFNENMLDNLFLC